MKSVWSNCWTEFQNTLLHQHIFKSLCNYLLCIQNLQICCSFFSDLWWFQIWLFFHQWSDNIYILYFKHIIFQLFNFKIAFLLIGSQAIITPARAIIVKVKRVVCSQIFFVLRQTLQKGCLYFSLSFSVILVLRALSGSFQGSKDFKASILRKRAFYTYAASLCSLLLLCVDR
jgi:hypothetical protein